MSTLLQEDQNYIAMPLVELQPDNRFNSNVDYAQEEISNCKGRILTHLTLYIRTYVSL